MKYSFILGLLLLCISCSDTNNSLEERPQNISTSEQLDLLCEKALGYTSQFEIDSMNFPRSARPEGELITTGSRDWTSGFYPGSLWQLYQHCEEESLRSAAKSWTAFIEKEKLDTHTHDLGFKIYCSFGEGYQLEQDPYYRKVILEGSEMLSRRYDEKIGAIKSWDFTKGVWQYPVIIDNMMNLEMLFAATRLSGDSMYYQMAKQHALTTLENHFRDDWSTYHVVDYDTISGQVRDKYTHQGAAKESAWARGQAWGLYGYTMTYRETNDERFLNTAKQIAQYFFNHPNLPEDKIPYWDFNAPKIPEEPRDVSAATIAASALLELYEYVPEQQEQYLEWADQILNSLSTDTYQSNLAPYLLDHSTGSFPGGTEIDVPLIYADYYYVEALLRKLAIEKNNSML